MFIAALFIIFKHRHKLSVHYEWVRRWDVCVCVYIPVHISIYTHTHIYIYIVGDRQGNLACYSPWGHKELDTNEQLN